MMPAACKSCVVCGVDAQETCAMCEDASYCGPAHQKEHWPAHKEACRPFRIQRNEVLGRFLVASRDIKAGELVLRERPLVVGPRIGSSILCLGCCRPLPSPAPLCVECDAAPLCSSTCPGRQHHADVECAQLRKASEGARSLLQTSLDAVLPLRCLLLAHSDCQRWDTFLTLEAHEVHRTPDSDIWRQHQRRIIQPLRDLGLLDVSDEVAQRVCGVLDVNSFELRAPASHERLRGVYLQAALMAHDCVANTHLAVDDSFLMTIHAAVDIARGAAITFNYTNALQGTADRREHLREGKYFECSCNRCQDPTEMGTHISSIICPHCRGFVTPVLGDPAAWSCGGCGRRYSAELMRRAVTCARDRVDEADPADTRALEALLRSLGRSLAPDHALLLQLRQQLADLYRGAVASGERVPRRLLLRQAEICRGMLPLLTIVEPGISRLRGIALYELHAPLVMLAHRDHGAGEINVEKLVSRLQEAEALLKEAVAALLFEPAQSPEGRLARTAMLDLRNLRADIHALATTLQPQPTQSKAKERRRKK